LGAARQSLQPMTPREKNSPSWNNASRRCAAENALLRQKIDLLVKRVFGSSSEQLDRPNWSCSCNCRKAAPSKPSSPHRRRSARKVHARKRVLRLPENLPVVEEVIDPEPVKAQPEQWRCIGQEVSEQLDYEPGRFLKRRVVRRKICSPDQP
jgi:transposase